MVPYPVCYCADCPDHDREFFGCGFDGFAGKGELRLGGLDEPYSHTCPQYFWAQPWVQRVHGDLGDYERGALGNVNDLEAPYLELLRAALGEQRKWKAVQDARIAEQAHKDVK